jgi:hypothetical protein
MDTPNSAHDRTFERLDGLLKKDRQACLEELSNAELTAIVPALLQERDTVAAQPEGQGTLRVCYT